MLILENLSVWWSFLNKYNLYFTSNVLTYRGELVVNDYYRKTFIANNLPNLYSGFFYFKKCNESHNFFTWVELVVKNWKLFYNKHLIKNYNQWLSFDLVVAIVVKILNIENKVTNKKIKSFTFTHMKPHVQNWTNIPNRWQDVAGVYLSDNCELKIGNYLQDKIFHYTENDFVTNEIITIYRNYLNV
jgi:hypothetical protein